VIDFDLLGGHALATDPYEWAFFHGLPVPVRRTALVSLTLATPYIRSPCYDGEKATRTSRAR